MSPQPGPAVSAGTRPGPAGPPRVLAIVLNYNGREMTLATVASLLALDYPGLGILVVDNGSTDGSDAAVAAAFPSVRRLRTAENLGISGGLNLGFRVGLEEGWDYLMPMNNDIEVAPGSAARAGRGGRGGSGDRLRRTEVLLLLRRPQPPLVDRRDAPLPRVGDPGDGEWGSSIAASTIATARSTT